MKFKQIVSIAFLTSSILLADNFHTQLIIPSVDIDNPAWEFAGNQIAQKEDDSFAQLVSKWTDTLDELWQRLNEKTIEELNASTEQLDRNLENSLFLDAYESYCKQVYADFINEEEFQETDTKVLNFIHLKLFYLQLNKPIKIHSNPNNMPLLTFAFGADKTGHHLILNKSIYNAETIETLYDCSVKKAFNYHIQPHTNIHSSQAIEYSNLLHLGITQAIAMTIHQGDYFSKLLQFLTYNQKQFSKETQTFGTDYIVFHAYLEACLQSKNPLEAALFLETKLDRFSQEYVLLWRDFIEDITNCYDPDDLEAYESLSLKLRREALYAMQGRNKD